MKVYKETSLNDFEAWSGGRDTLTFLQNHLTSDQLNDLEIQILEAMGYSEEEPIDETALNDFLWFEDDTIANILGYDSWEEFEKRINKEENDDEEEDDE